MQRLLRSSISRRVLLLALALVVGAGLGLGAVAVWAGSDAGPAPAIRAQAAQVPDPATTEPTAPDEGAVPADVPAPAPEPAPAEAPVLDEAPAPAEAPLPAEAPPAPRLSLAKVKAIALKAAPPGRVVEIDDDEEPTGLRYDVTILHANRTSTDVEVDATTGEITGIDHDDDWD